MRSTHAPIQAFVGLNGSGKTLAAMALVVLPVLDRGGLAMSTCAIDHPAAALFTGWRELVEMERTRTAAKARGETLPPLVLFLDEITSSLPSRQSMQLPPQLARLFNQLRKVNVQLCWTAPNWARADKLLREVTGTVTVCRGTFPDKWQRADDGRSKLRVDGKAVRAGRDWAPNRLFRFKTYSAEDFEEFTLSKTAKLKPVGTTWYVRKRHDAHLRYDTNAPVELLDHVDDAGLCIECGGTRPRAKCTCSTDHGHAPVEAAVAAGPALAITREPEPSVVPEPLYVPEWVDEYLRYQDGRKVEDVGAVDAWTRWEREQPAADTRRFWSEAS